jgi:hypothetical protein
MLVDDAGESIVCATCGRALDGNDPDEDQFDLPGAPICGECDRARSQFMYETGRTTTRRSMIDPLDTMPESRVAAARGRR